MKAIRYRRAGTCPGLRLTQESAVNFHGGQRSRFIPKTIWEMAR